MPSKSITLKKDLMYNPDLQRVLVVQLVAASITAHGKLPEDLTPFIKLAERISDEVAVHQTDEQTDKPDPEE